MKRTYSLIIFTAIVAGATTLSSCESCAKKTAKKTTEIGLSVIEGISEAVSEKGDQVSEKAADALGVVAEGAGRSISKQLDEHAKDVASVLGRTVVQSVEGLQEGFSAEFYNEIKFTGSFVQDAALTFVGKSNNYPVIDAYFIVSSENSFSCNFEFKNSENNTLIKRSAEINKIDRLVSFALTPEEEASLPKVIIVDVTVAKK